MKRFISFSGGVESTTMCILYGKGAVALTADTKAEHDEMYDRLTHCERALSEIHDGDFELKRLYANTKIKGQYTDSLIDAIQLYKYMPSPDKRWCTRQFKIEPIDDFLLDQGECELLIGFNADEEPSKDRTGNLMRCENVTYRYPLYEDGYTRSDCEEILREHNLHPDFPIYMQRGGCFMCIYKSIPEYKAMYFFDRKTFDKARELEESVQDKRQKFFAISTSMIPLSVVAMECEQEISLFGRSAIEAQYKKLRTESSCGAFCHR